MRSHGSTKASTVSALTAVTKSIRIGSVRSHGHVGAYLARDSWRSRSVLRSPVGSLPLLNMTTFTAQLMDELFNQAGLTHDEAVQLIHGSGLRLPVEPELEDFANIPPTIVSINASAYRVAQVCAMIRVALTLKALRAQGAISTPHVAA